MFNSIFFNSIFFSLTVGVEGAQAQGGAWLGPRAAALHQRRQPLRRQQPPGHLRLEAEAAERGPREPAHVCFLI